MTDYLAAFEKYLPPPQYARSWEVGSRFVTIIIERRGAAWEWRTSVYRTSGLGRNCVDGSSGRRDTPEEAAAEAVKWVEKTRATWKEKA